MAINTVGQFQEILNNYNSKDWVKSAELNIKDPVFLQEHPKTGEVNKSFGEFLTDSVAKVNAIQGEANTAIQRLVTGETKNLHETLLLVEKADLAFRTMNQVRQKVLDAYKEIMKMQI